MELFKTDPGKIKVKDGLDRFRKDMGDIESLANSIKRTRQIQPIIVSRDNELIAGGRRLAACIFAKVDVLCVYTDIVDDFEMRELELEENFYRKNYTPAEEVLAIKELHELKQKLHGATSAGIAGGHTLTDTAKILGKSKASVINDLEIAAMIEAFPELAQAGKKSDIKRAMKGMQKVLTASEGLDKLSAAKNSGEKMYKIAMADAIAHMAKMKKKSIDILLTDPLYGIEADENLQGIGGKIGGELTTSGYQIKDRQEEAFGLLEVLAKESDKFCKETSHAYIFCGPEFFNRISFTFEAHGWIACPRPFIWIKRRTGQNNQPSIWPTSAYEMAVYLRRPKARLVREGLPDWEQCDPVLPAEKLHQYEKPVSLVTKLLERIAIPGQTLYDPFMGSGAIIESGVRYGLFCHGVDIDKFAFAAASHRLATYYATKDDEGLMKELFSGTEFEGKERKVAISGEVK